MRTRGFQVTTRSESAGAVVAPSGDLDMAAMSRFDEALRAAQAAGGPLTVDLSNLDFIDSSGLGVLLRFDDAATRAGLQYRLIAGPPQVHRAFVLCGLDHALRFT